MAAQPRPDAGGVRGNSGTAGEWRLCSDGRCKTLRKTLSEILGHPVGMDTTTMSVCP
jgi:hypothetical protein